MKNQTIPKRLHAAISKLLSTTMNLVGSDKGLHEMELTIFEDVLKLGHTFLCHVLEQKSEEFSEVRPIQNQGEKVEYKGCKTIKYLTILGEVELNRPIYWSKERGSIFVLDEILKLPVASHLSYTLQELLGENASEGDYRESVRLLNKLLHLGLSGKGSERNAGHLGPLVEGYYEGEQEPLEGEGLCFSASFDGKGVPRIKYDGKEKKDGKRLGKGEKNGVMQMATVGVMSSFTPKERTAESIIRGLMGSPLSPVEQDEEGKEERQNDNRWHKNIHRRAFLGNQPKAIDYGLAHLKERIQNPRSKFVVPIDAGSGLEEAVVAAVEKYGLQSQFDGIILDIVHVSEYVWKAATAIFGEKSKLRSKWVRQMLLDLLEGKTSTVITDLEKIRDKTTLSKTKKEKVEMAITYFTNHQHKMNYKDFLAKGYPVSSALVESSCGHFVKERMEQSGMRWSSLGAQNILDLRAVMLNDNFPDFMQFVIQEERKAA